MIYWLFPAPSILHIIEIGYPADDSFPVAAVEAKTIVIILWPIIFAATAT